MQESEPFQDLIENARMFLSELSENNSRAWFRENKNRFDDDVKRPAERLMAHVARRLGHDLGTPVKPKLFRPHRDVRFSEDKTPYHIHLHMLWSLPDGRGWFFGLSPTYTTAGSGMMHFDEEELAAYRGAVAGLAGEALSTILASQDWRLDPPRQDDVPQPYPTDHPRAALLRRDGLVVWADNIGERLVPDPVSGLIELFTLQRPVSDWLAQHLR